jgi:ankyrin repeat protein
VIGIVSAVGFAADVSQCAQLCGTTFRAGDRGATNDMLVQSLRLQCSAREARAAECEEFAFFRTEDDDGEYTINCATQLIRAAILNNLPRVLQLIQLSAPLDLGDEHGYSPLDWACDMGHEHVAKALLDGKFEGCGATVDSIGKRGCTPLMSASMRGHEATVRLLVSRGAKVELQDIIGDTAVHRAVVCHQAGIVALLCAAPGAAFALALKNRSGFTPLAIAVDHGHAACEAVLRAHGAPE